MTKLKVSLAVLAIVSAALTASTAATAGPGEKQSRGTCHPRTATLFCEDFERLAPGGASTSTKWDVDTRHGTLKVVQARGRGQVLEVHTEENGYAFLKVLDFQAPANSFYGRLRLKVDAFPTTPDWAHYTLVEATGSGSSEVVRPIGGQYVPTLQKNLWGVGADGGPTGDWTNWRESAPTVDDRWVCLEWSVRAADNRIDVWIDGVPKPDLTVSTTEHGGNPVDFILPQVNTIKIGWQLYQPNQQEHDLWLDDIALATSRLGC